MFVVLPFMVMDILPPGCMLLRHSDFYRFPDLSSPCIVHAIREHQIECRLRTKKYCKTIDETGSDDVFRKQYTCTLPVDRIDLSSLVDGKNDKYVKVPGNGRQSGTDRKNAMQ